jgi:hypothetical protein
MLMANIDRVVSNYLDFGGYVRIIKVRLDKKCKKIKIKLSSI